jgi:ribosomal protein L14
MEEGLFYRQCSCFVKDEKGNPKGTQIRGCCERISGKMEEVAKIASVVY